VSGVKSATGSNGSEGYSVALIAWLVKLISNELPSRTAPARAATSLPMPSPKQLIL
jgi:hypothetical protein